MIRETLIGAVAGEAGTVALNVTTYLDMTVRGRPSSNGPSKMVDILAKSIGLSYSAQGGGSQDLAMQNRESGLGALLGYVNGLGTGIAYGLLRTRLKHVPIPLASIGVGLSAMAVSDVPLVALRVSNPKTWGFAGWAADIISHLVYGLVTVITNEALNSAEGH
ncbi:MAG: hypothetical protein NVS3B14_08750 [Ktedonobacteraceae bacterium]